MNTIEICHRTLDARSLMEVAWKSHRSRLGVRRKKLGGFGFGFGLEGEMNVDFF